MRYALVAYDLKRTSPMDNKSVKKAVSSYSDTQFKLRVINDYSVVPQWVTISLPDTTFLVEIVDDSLKAKAVAERVVEVIHSIGANVSKVFVSLLSNERDDTFIIGEPSK